MSSSSLSLQVLDALEPLAAPERPLREQVPSAVEGRASQALQSLFDLPGAVRFAERLRSEGLVRTSAGDLRAPETSHPGLDELEGEEWGHWRSSFASLAAEVRERVDWLRSSAARPPKRRVSLTPEEAARWPSGSVPPQAVDAEELVAMMREVQVVGPTVKRKPRGPYLKAISAVAGDLAAPQQERVMKSLRKLRSELVLLREDFGRVLQAGPAQVAQLERLDEGLHRAIGSRFNRAYVDLCGALQTRLTRELETALHLLPRTVLLAADERLLLEVEHWLGPEGFVGQQEQAISHIVSAVVEVECGGLEALLESASDLVERDEAALSDRASRAREERVS